MSSKKGVIHIIIDRQLFVSLQLERMWLTRPSFEFFLSLLKGAVIEPFGIETILRDSGKKSCSAVIEPFVIETPV